MTDKWLPFELHCHTYHSDGKQSLAELAAAAKALGLSGVALTDHNTMTGLADRDNVAEQSGVEIIPGLEWTTFFGHMLTLGIREYVDWRNLSPFHLHRGIEGVHRQGGLVGIAHPFRVGSPMCTGCYWEFEVSDWNAVDYIEVWSGLFPSIRRNNARAFALWTELLNRGYRIAATSGRDWHVSDPASEPVSATFLGIREGGAGEWGGGLARGAGSAGGDDGEGASCEREGDAGGLARGAGSASGGDGEGASCEREGGAGGLARGAGSAGGDNAGLIGGALDALRHGRAAVSMGPLPLLGVLAADGSRAGIGDTVALQRERQPVVITAGIDFDARAGHWELPEQQLQLKLVGNLGEMADVALSRQKPQTELRLDLSGVRWLRGELHGVFGHVRTMIGFTNAIYFT
ncbi:CehA/McbA family metallohydrolase [Paenibacillus piri]|uniref:CehA/McbA family metallohydrolase n=1 Tax=Paenibacillus piri TaxID=2547395 RepID=UPI001404933F|nr:CehA/McbA family metallohydrolase [Paenibacillus piri]